MFGVGLMAALLSSIHSHSASATSFWVDHHALDSERVRPQEGKIGGPPATLSVSRSTPSYGTIKHDAALSPPFADGHGEMNFVDSRKYIIAARIVGFDGMMPVCVEFLFTALTRPARGGGAQRGEGGAQAIVQKTY